MPKKGLGDSRQRRSMRRYLTGKLEAKEGNKGDCNRPRFKNVENGRETWETELAHKDGGA